MRLTAIAALSAALTLTAALSASAESEAVQLTHGFFDSPSMSPDGKRMAVVTLVGGVEQIATMAMDGSDVRILTRGADNLEDPAWSPDGRSIAYVSFANDTQTVWVMNADGTGARSLTPREHHAIHPIWTPDSREVIYCSNDDLAPPAKNAAQIYAIDVSSRAVRTIIAGGVNTYPALSPDGRRLAFRKMVDETNSEVWIANADGSDQRNVTNSPAFDGWPSWSPDGKRIVFGSDRGGNSQIWVMAADGAGARRVAAAPNRGTYPKWSNDGATIYWPICARLPEGGATCEIWQAPAPPA